MRRHLLLLGFCALLITGHTVSAVAHEDARTPSAMSAPATAPNWVVAENRKPGTRTWRLTKRGAADAVQGFADATSVAPGESFSLFVETTASRWRFTAYRIGWYHGYGARRITESAWHARQKQPKARIYGKTRTVAARWRKSATVSTKGWPSGCYLLKLHSSAGAERYVPITVRTSSAAHRTVLMNENLTWQAYNTWGGRSLYLGPGGYGGRSFAVSFDRPYDRGGDFKFQEFEQPLINRAERLGLDMAYTTDVYVSAHPYSLTGARTILSPGHDEYWTWNKRTAVTSARDHGTNLAFLGANEQYWQVRLGSDWHGAGRLVICYKTDYGRDPKHGTEYATRLWRNLPHPKPENRLVGLMYECYPVLGAYVVQTPGFFGFRGTGAHRGSTYAGLVGIEIDRAYPNSNTPHPIQIVGHSPVTCRGVHTYSDTAYYTTRSGAGVFSTGTTRWVQALRGPMPQYGVGSRSVAFVRAVTDNVLRAFSEGPAGRRYPAKDNLRSLHESPVNSTGAISGDDTD